MIHDHQGYHHDNHDHNHNHDHENYNFDFLEERSCSCQCEAEFPTFREDTAACVETVQGDPDDHDKYGDDHDVMIIIIITPAHVALVCVRSLLTPDRLGSHTVAHLRTPLCVSVSAVSHCNVLQWNVSCINNRHHSHTLAPLHCLGAIHISRQPPEGGGGVSQMLANADKGGVWV